MKHRYLKVLFYITILSTVTLYLVDFYSIRSYSVVLFATNSKVWNANSKIGSILSRGHSQKAYYHTIESYHYPFRFYNMDALKKEFHTEIDNSLSECGWWECSKQEIEESTQGIRAKKKKNLYNNFTFHNSDTISTLQYPPYYLFYYSDFKNTQDPFLNDDFFTPQEKARWNAVQTKWLSIYGEIRSEFSYGKAFGDREGRSEIISSKISNGFDPSIDLKMKVRGRIGEKLALDINYNKFEAQSDNIFKVQYQANRKQDFIQEIKFGDIPLDFAYSEFAIYNKLNKQSLGLEAKMQKGRFKLHSIATLSQTQSATEKFIGKSSVEGIELYDYNYIKHKYYQLEPFLYYDGITSPPSITEDSYTHDSPSRLVTLTSHTNNNNPLQFSPIYIDSTSLEVYLDDEDASNDQIDGAIEKVINSTTIGIFHRLSPNIDYTLSPSSGQLVFTSNLSLQSNIYVRYTHNNGSTLTSDPSARIIDGKIEVFIKYGASLNEDTSQNGQADVESIPDSLTNYDIYEVRGIYNLGAKNIQEESFNIRLQNTENSILTLDPLNSYYIDFKEGLLIFETREPFRNLYNNISDPSFPSLTELYRENPSPETLDSYSNHYLFKIDYKSDLSYYKLQHTNIIKDSIKVSINGHTYTNTDEVTYYHIEPISGYIQFVEQTNFHISPNDNIEINYEYIPFGTNISQSYILGLRADYEITEYLNLGGSILYNGIFSDSTAPDVGSEASSSLILEADSLLNLDEEQMTKFINLLPGINIDLLPIEITSYAEYASSFYNPNIFDIAIIDNMEGSDTSFYLPIAEEDWQISSIPSFLPTAHQCTRSPLYYRVYKILSNNTVLNTPLNQNENIYYIDNIPLAGPYNIQASHLNSNQISFSRGYIPTSLVLDFDFSQAENTGEKFASIVSRRLSHGIIDLSNYKYIEFYAKLESSDSTIPQIRVSIDAGVVSEDSDEDLLYDSEETIQPYDFTYSFAEDNGYLFNPTSQGNSCQNFIVGGPITVSGERIYNNVLNTEDLNRNSIIDSTENTVLFDQSQSYIYFDTSVGTTSNIISSSNWSLVRMYFDTNDSSFNSDIIRKVEQVRITMSPESTFENSSGKLIISQIRFGGLQWNQGIGYIQAQNSPTSINDPNIIQSSIINTEDHNSEYYSDSFIIDERSTWEELYGKQTNNDITRIRESTLKIQYTLTPNINTSYESILLTHSYIPLDIRFYNKLNLWVNTRNKQDPQDQLIVRIGSSPSDYYEYIVDLSSQTGWNKISLSLTDLNSFLQVGNVNLREITYMAIGIYNPNTTASNNSDNGVLWVDEIYVSDAVTQQDDAYKYNITAKLNYPLFKINKNYSLFNNTILQYNTRYKGPSFQTIGSNENNTQENKYQAEIQSQITPFWKALYNILVFETNTDHINSSTNLRELGKTDNLIHSIKNYMNFQNKYTPKLDLAYKYNQTNNQNFIQQTNSDEEIQEYTNYKIHTSSIYITENLPPISFLNTQYTLNINLVFQTFQQRNNINTIANILNNEVEKRQNESLQQSLNFAFKNSSLRVSHQWERNVLLYKNYIDSNTEILTSLSNDFTAPILSLPKNSRLYYRLNDFNLLLNIRDLWLINPSIEWNIKYKEDNFRDNVLSITQDSYQRLKNAITNTNLKLGLDFNINKIIPNKNIIRNIRPEFKREVLLNERNLPEHINSNLYSDKLLFQRVLPPLLNHTFNLFSYPVWHYFLSPKSSTPNSFGYARQFIQQNTLSLHSYITSDPLLNQASSLYTNILLLREYFDIQLDWVFFTPLSLTTGFHLYQEVSRPTTSNNNEIPEAIHSGRWSIQVLQKYNLMQIFNFGLFTNKSNSSYFILDTIYERNLEFTSNKVIEQIKPKTALSFRWRSPTLPNIQYFLIEYSLNLTLNTYNKFFTNTTANVLDLITFQQSDLANIISNEITQFQTSIQMTYKIQILSLQHLLEKTTTFKIRQAPEYEVSFLFEWEEVSNRLYTSQSSLKEYYILSNQLNFNLHVNLEGFLKLLTGMERITSFTQNINNQNKDSKTLDRFLLEIKFNVSAKF